MASFVVAAWMVALAAGCSEFAVRSSTGKYQLSARTIDFYVSFDSRIRGLKQGSTMTLPAVCPTCEPQTLKTKYDIVGTVSALDYENHFSDGLNSAGLSVGMLYDDGVQPVMNMTGTKPAIPFLFVAGYILANFKTVAEVQAAMKPELLELTTAWTSPKVPLFFMPMHFGINDVTGASAVLELEETGNFVVRPNPLRVMTNSPNLPLHNQYYEEFVNNQALVPPFIAEDLDAMFPGHDVKSRFVNVPGDSTSASRRIRLALLRQLQEQGGPLPHNISYLGYLPDSAESWSPNYGGNEWLEAFAMTVNTMQRNVVVNGLADGIKINLEKTMNHAFDPFETVGAEHTLVMQIRDHMNGVYFWWTHRAQRWQSIDMKSMKRSFLTHLTPLTAVTTSFYDRTAEMNGVGVRVSATGAVAPGLCRAPRCPAQVRGLSIRCDCGGETAYRGASGPAPLVKSDVEKIIAGYPWAGGDYPVVPMGDKGVLTIQVTSCGDLSPQQCCSAFAAAVRTEQTVLPSKAPVACFTADGATMAPHLH